MPDAPPPTQHDLFVDADQKAERERAIDAIRQTRARIRAKFGLPSISGDPIISKEELAQERRKERD